MPPVQKRNTLRRFLILTVIILLPLCLLSGGFWYLQKQQAIALQEQIALEQIEQERLKKIEKDKAEINVLVSVYIDEFIQDLRQGAKNYKEQKHVLYELIQPYNFETPEYARENYDFFKNNIAPAMRNSADDIMAVFARYTSLLENDLRDKDTEIQKIFLSEWEEMSAEQASDFVDFLTKEEKVLQAYDDLITFYYVHSNLYHIDMIDNVFVFKRDEDALKQEQLLDVIKLSD